MHAWMHDCLTVWLFYCCCEWLCVGVWGVVVCCDLMVVCVSFLLLWCFCCVCVSIVLLSSLYCLFTCSSRLSFSFLVVVYGLVVFVVLGSFCVSVCDCVGHMVVLAVCILCILVVGRLVYSVQSRNRCFYIPSILCVLYALYYEVWRMTTMRPRAMKGRWVLWSSTVAYAETKHYHTLRLMVCVVRILLGWKNEHLWFRRGSGEASHSKETSLQRGARIKINEEFTNDEIVAIRNALCFYLMGIEWNDEYSALLNKLKNVFLMHIDTGVQ